MEAARLRQRRSSRGWTREKVRALRSRTMPKENDLEGTQDQGGKHGGQAGMPTSEARPLARRPVWGGGVAARAWRASAAAGARVRAFPRLILVDLADPAGVFASQTRRGFLHQPPKAGGLRALTPPPSSSVLR